MELIATIASPEEFRRALIATVAIGVVAFGICGALLAGFIRSLSREGERGETQFTRGSAVWLGALIASLLIFSAIFLWFGMQWS